MVQQTVNDVRERLRGGGRQSPPAAAPAPEPEARGIKLDSDDPFGSVFDESLSKMLQDAGYTDLEVLGRASPDDLMAINGVGPVALERIRDTLQAQGIKWTQG